MEAGLKARSPELLLTLMLGHRVGALPGPLYLFPPRNSADWRPMDAFYQFLSEENFLFGLARQGQGVHTTPSAPSLEGH